MGAGTESVLSTLPLGLRRWLALLALDNHSAGVLHPEAIDIYAALALAVPVTSYFGVIHLLPAGWRARWPRELVVACLGPCDIS